MNLITPETILAATQTVRKGSVFPLDISYDYVKPLLFHRSNARRTLFELRPGQTLDDVHDNVFPQGGSQWDALGHQAFSPGQFYNGVTTEQMLRGEANTIEHWAQKGIVARGVVLDLSEVVRERGGPGNSVPISPTDLDRARQKAGLDYRVGDVMLIHTGFLRWYGQQGPEEKLRLSRPEALTAAGIEHSEEMAEYLWDAGLAGVISDGPGLEVWPPDRRAEAWPFGFLHHILLGQFGMAIGELWWLYDLVQDCGLDGVYQCLLTSAPINAPGGVGSPANALAIK